MTFTYDAGTYANPYTDVAPDHWAAGQIYSLHTVGGASTAADPDGCAANPLRYCPDDGMTRAESAIFLTRAFDLPLPDDAGNPPVSYTYPAAGQSRPHAVTARSNGDSFQYDANGNMTQRVEVSGTQTITYTQQWDADNRLTVITNTLSGEVWQFVYNGDGERVKQMHADGTATLYAGDLYETTLPPADWLFAGGFESGLVPPWSATGGGGLSVTTAAALEVGGNHEPLLWPAGRH